MDRDEEDLRRLALAHYAVGVLTALMALPFAWGIWWGIDWIRHPEAHRGWLAHAQELNLPPELLGQMLVFFFASSTLLVLLHAAVVAWVGWCLAKARRYWVIYIFSLLDCTYVPFGTIIGVWALVVLSQPSVKMRFGLPQQPLPAETAAMRTMEHPERGADSSRPPV